MKPKIVHEDGYDFQKAKEQANDAFSCKSQSACSKLALAIAEELMCDYSILAHDGNLLAGEHYWVDLDELTIYIDDSIQRNSNVTDELP